MDKRVQNLEKSIAEILGLFEQMGLNLPTSSEGLTPKTSTPKMNLKEFLQKQKPADNRPKSQQERRIPKLKVGLDGYLSKLGNAGIEDDQNRPNS